MGKLFGDWLEKKYLEWQLQHGRTSIRNFAKWLGINQALVVQWMKGKGNPGEKNATLIASRLGTEVYIMLDMPIPSHIPLDHLPPDLREQLSAAVYEANSELSSRGLSSDSPEAIEIVINIFESHGLKYTRTIQE